jgi:hypothetical protein
MITLVGALLVGCAHPPEAMDVVKQDKSEVYRYRLCEQIEYPTPFVGFTLRYRYTRLAPDGVLTLERGFQWDGPSFAPDATRFMRASAFHDALYRMFRAGDLPIETQARADEVLHQIASEDGYLGADVVFAGVRAFGSLSTRSRARGDELPTTTPSARMTPQRCRALGVNEERK